MTYAFVWALFGIGSKYVPMVLCSMRSCKTKHDKIVMYTPGSITEDDIKRLTKEATDVIEVQEITAPYVGLPTKKQQDMYKDWINVSFTKWNCLALTQYKKVCFMDADTIFVRDCDHLFDLPAPAATFSSPYAYPYVKYSQIKLHYPQKHGSFITSEHVRKALRGKSVVCCGSTVLLEPGEGLLEKFKEFLQTKWKGGSETCYSGADEQSISQFLALDQDKDWSYIDQTYNMVPWKEDIWNVNKLPVSIIHYFGTVKPTEMKLEDWPDLKFFFQTYDIIKQEYYSSSSSSSS